MEQTRVFQKSKDWCGGDLFFENIESTTQIVTLPTSYISKNQLAKTFMTVRKPTLAAVQLIKGWPLFKLSIGKGGATLSNKIKILFLRRAAAPLVGVAIPLYKRVSLSHKIAIPLRREAARPLAKIAVLLYKRVSQSLT